MVEIRLVHGSWKREDSNRQGIEVRKVMTEITASPSQLTSECVGIRRLP